MKKTLVIGYGNTLRSDDGVGVRVVEEISTLHLPGVETRTCHQLGLELAEEFPGFDAVVFVDAAVDGPPIRHSTFPPDASPQSPLAHNVTPASLLEGAFALYGARPEAHLFTVRGESFEFGTVLSPPVKRRAAETVSRVRMFLQSAS